MSDVVNMTNMNFHKSGAQNLKLLLYKRSRPIFKGNGADRHSAIGKHNHLLKVECRHGVTRCSAFPVGSMAAGLKFSELGKPVPLDIFE